MSQSSTQEFRKSLKRPDAFSKWLKSFMDSIWTHGKEWLIAVGFFVLVGGGYSVWSSAKESKQKEASQAFYLIQKTYQDEMKPLVNAQTPSEDLSKLKDKNLKNPQATSELEALSKAEKAKHLNFKVEEKLPKTMAALKKAGEDFKGTASGFEALLMTGDLLYRHESATAAIGWYEKAEQSAPDTFAKGLSLMALAYSYENSKQNDKAISTFEKAINLGEPSFKVDALFGIARNQEALGKKDLAKGAYDRITTEFVGTENARTAELYKSRL